jgi:hypothetical protein
MFATSVIIISTRIATGIYPASLVSPTGTKFGCINQKVPNKTGEGRKYNVGRNLARHFLKELKKRQNFYFLFLHEAGT